MSLTEILPQPRTVTLAGRPFQVSPLRIVDLARIQAWLEEAVPHPFEEHRDRISGTEGRERKKALMRLQRTIAAVNWPPVYPSPYTSALFGTCEGGRFFFSLVLGRDNRLDEEELRHVIRHTTRQERDRLDDVLWGGTPQREYEMALNSPQILKGGRPIDWCEAFARIGEKYGLSPEQIGLMTVGQFNVYRFGHGRPAVTGVSWTHMSQEQRQAEWDLSRQIRAELDTEETPEAEV